MTMALQLDRLNVISLYSNHLRPYMDVWCLCGLWSFYRCVLKLAPLKLPAPEKNRPIRLKISRTNPPKYRSIPGFFSVYFTLLKKSLNSIFLSRSPKNKKVAKSNDFRKKKEYLFSKKIFLCYNNLIRNLSINISIEEIHYIYIHNWEHAMVMFYTYYYIPKSTIWYTKLEWSVTRLLIKCSKTITSFARKIWLTIRKVWFY